MTPLGLWVTLSLQSNFGFPRYPQKNILLAANIEVYRIVLFYDLRQEQQVSFPLHLDASATFKLRKANDEIMMFQQPGEFSFVADLALGASLWSLSIENRLLTPDDPSLKMDTTLGVQKGQATVQTMK